MVNKKKKINTGKYNQLENFVVEMTFDETITTLDASEKDIPQILSRIIEEDADAKLLRLTYAEAAALLVLVKSWAHGSMAQITIFRAKANNYAPMDEMPKTFQNYNSNGNAHFAYLGLLLMPILAGLFLVLRFDIRSLPNTVAAWVVILGLMILLGFMKWMLPSTKVPRRKSKKEDAQLISASPIKANNIYEDLLLDYVKKKLQAYSEDVIYNENAEDYKHLKRGQ